MATVIPSIQFTDFKKLSAQQLKEMKSCEVTFNSSYLFTFVNAQTDFVKMQVEYTAQLGNAVGGKSFEDVK